tara:strand:- start:2017 stop:2706 length:690 start_codon:yes stop_codon:yes gene_type:complete
MANEFSLEVSKREISTKGNIKSLRRENQVPGVFYSHDSKSSIPFSIEKKMLKEAHKSGARIFNINVGGKKRTVIFKSVQYHPITDEVIHVDLYGVKMDQMVAVSVELKLIGTAVGIKEGGILVQGLSELSIECLPMNIPEFLEIDIAHLQLGDSMRVEDLDLDKNINILSNPDQILASVTHPMKEVEPEVSEEEMDEEFMEEEGSEDKKDTGDDKPETSDSDKNDSKES